MVCLLLLSSAATFFSLNRSEAGAAAGGRLGIAGDTLYVAGIGHGFHVFDLSDARHPKWTGSWQNRTCPVGVQVVDGFAYLANRTSGFDVIDVHNPSAPSLVGHLNTGGDLQTVHVAGRFAYIADERRGVDIIDVSDSKQPKLAGEFDTKGQGWGAVANGDHLYAGYGGGVLRIYHLTNGTNPTLVRAIPGAGGFNMQIVDGKLLTQNFGKLCLMDLQNPADPVVVADSPVPLSVFWSAAVRDSLLFVTGGSLNLGVCNIGAQPKIQLLGSVRAGYQSWGLALHGSVAYVVDGGSNLHIFDVSDPARPAEIGRIGTENFCSQVISLADAQSRGGIPTVPGSAITDAPPQLADTVQALDGVFSFVLSGVPGGVYQIQASTNMVDWTAISTSTLPSVGVLRIFDTNAHRFQNRFYRAAKKN
jgi:hypothetical protein